MWKPAYQYERALRFGVHPKSLWGGLRNLNVTYKKAFIRLAWDIDPKRRTTALYSKAFPQLRRFAQRWLCFTAFTRITETTVAAFASKAKGSEGSLIRTGKCYKHPQADAEKRRIFPGKIEDHKKAGRPISLYQ